MDRGVSRKRAEVINFEGPLYLSEVLPFVGRHSGSRRPRPLAVEECGHRMTGPSRRMTGNVAPRGVGQGTTGFARGAPFND
jgi:hypothetical protein